MNSKNTREGSVGDTWHGLLGKEYKKNLMNNLVKPCLETPDSCSQYGLYHTFTKKMGDLSVRATSIRNDGTKTMSFASIVPIFQSEYESIIFEVEKVDVWTNGAEATLAGSIFNSRSFSFFCQNYPEYKDINLIGKKLRVNVAVVSQWAHILPAKERSIVHEAGPFKGQSVSLMHMRYLNPNLESDPELCEFFFPIQDIKIITFMGNDVYKIKGVLSNIDNDRDYYYDVYIHPSLIEKPEELKIGEPFVGTGWLQAEIRDIR